MNLGNLDPVQHLLVMVPSKVIASDLTATSAKTRKRHHHDVARAQLNTDRPGNFQMVLIYIKEHNETIGNPASHKNLHSNPSRDLQETKTGYLYLK